MIESSVAMPGNKKFTDKKFEFTRATYGSIWSNVIKSNVVDGQKV